MNDSLLLPQNNTLFGVPPDRFQRMLVIGLGGIGTALLPHLGRYLVYAARGSIVPLILMDGDQFERRNRERQDFARTGNKAQVKAQELRGLFPELTLRAVPEYLTADNAAFYIEDESLIFLAVDNHASRRAVSRHCEGLRSVALLSGGNEWTDGNVQIYLRTNGQDVTPPLTRFHPEIDAATDASGLFSCDEAVGEGEPQLLFTNLAVASHLLNTFYALIAGQLSYEEIYFDIISGKSVPVRRAP